MGMKDVRKKEGGGGGGVGGGLRVIFSIRFYSAFYLNVFFFHKAITIVEAIKSFPWLNCTKDEFYLNRQRSITGKYYNFQKHIATDISSKLRRIYWGDFSSIHWHPNLLKFKCNVTMRSQSYDVLHITYITYAGDGIFNQYMSLNICMLGCLKGSPWWRHQMETFSALLVICAEFTGHRWIPHTIKSQWRGTLMFALICTSINGWVNNHEGGDLRRHYDVTVLCTDIGVNDQLGGWYSSCLTIRFD